MKNIILAIALYSICSLSQASEIYECRIKGSVVFQSKPCPENVKTYEQVFNVQKQSQQEKQEIEERHKAEYEERLRKSAAQRGDLIIMPKHKQIKVDALKATTKAMPFDDCKKFVNDARLSTNKEFKTSIISDSKSEYLARICRKDGSIILACDAAQNRLVITKSAYCALK